MVTTTVDPYGTQSVVTEGKNIMMGSPCPRGMEGKKIWLIGASRACTIEHTLLMNLQETRVCPVR